MIYNKNIRSLKDMRTVEETLKGLKETVANQKIKINDLDKKLDDLESALRYEKSVNKVLIKFLKDKFGSEFIERVESNL